MNSALTILDGSDVYLEMEESVDCLSNSVDLLRDAIDEVSEI